MKPAPFNLLLQTASRDNILTLTTACSTSCVFCSHLQNPPDVEAYYVNKLSLEEALQLIEFLNKDEKIVIGESATRICEGEPFLYPGISDVLKAIRGKYPETPLQVTTSAVPLTEKLLENIRDMGGIGLNVSLNSCTTEGRSRLYGGRPLMQAAEAVRQLHGYGIGFSGSIVAMPQLVGLQDIRETIEFLSLHGAETIRVFIPGFTKYSKLPVPEETEIDGLRALVTELRGSLRTPVTLEPAALTDLAAFAEGVAAGSPSDIAGLKTGDRITGVNGEAVFSRVDAYYRLLNSRNPRVHYMRGSEKGTVVIAKEKKAASGLVFSYDMHPDTVAQINGALGRCKTGKRLVLTSGLAFGLLAGCIEQNENTRAEPVKNRYFGGNIACAGLLTMEDIFLHLEQSSFKPDMVLLPSIMFDERGRDLTGRSCDELAARYGIEVKIV